VRALRNPPLADAVCARLDHLACWRAFARAAGQPLERPDTDLPFRYGSSSKPCGPPRACVPATTPAVARFRSPPGPRTEVMDAGGRGLTRRVAKHPGKTWISSWTGCRGTARWLRGPRAGLHIGDIVLAWPLPSSNSFCMGCSSPPADSPSPLVASVQGTRPAAIMSVTLPTIAAGRGQSHPPVASRPWPVASCLRERAC
jgi:hypothetical protein